MKKLLFFLAIACCAVVTARAYTAADSAVMAGKLSVTTQMFLNDRSAAASQQQPEKAPSMPRGLVPASRDMARAVRVYAQPEQVGGRQYVPCFIRLAAGGSVGSLEAKGVQVQCTFGNGLLTALVPVDSIEAVALLAGVSRVNVSSVMRKATDAARTATHADDVLTRSLDAVGLGIDSVYDGKGVVLGVIDTGIDFQHIAFKDASLSSRIKRAYVYNGTSAREYTSITSSSPTTDDSGEDHGTHTSSTAGGSSVIIDGSNVTVTTDHSAATYGGMAPGADLYLAGIKDLTTTYIANAFQKICNYADGEGKPVVVSNSWGSQMGPHDGTGDVADVVNQYFGESHPNHICLFAASNDAGKSKDDEGGGFYVTGTASSASPLKTIMRCASYSNTAAGYYYAGVIANAWSHTPLPAGSSLACRIRVLNATTGSELTSVTVAPSTNGTRVSGLGSYYTGTLMVYKDYVASSKSQIVLYTSGLTSRGVSSSTKNGEEYYKSNYTLAVDFYPTQGSCTVDAWGGSYGYFSNYLNLDGYTSGSDASSVSDEATIANAIAIGAYVTKNTVTDHNGSRHTLSSLPNVGDIAYFSSYQESGAGATGEVVPVVAAPGATIVAAVNHYDSDGDYSYVNDNGADYDMYRVNNSTVNPYGNMNGTSMATPAAAGIVALWLQASQVKGAKYTNLTVDKVKEIMRSTAITDTWTTTGSNRTHFGAGKINALAGLQMVLGAQPGPRLGVEPSTLAFGTVGLGTDSVKTFKVTGQRLKKSVTIASSNKAFAVSPATIALPADSTLSQTVSVTFKPDKSGDYKGYIVVTSDSLTDTVAVSGTARLVTVAPVMLPADSARIGLTQFQARWTPATPAAHVASYTLSVDAKPETAWTKLWTDDFSSLPASTSAGTNISNNLDNYTDVKGWTGSYVYGSGSRGVLQIGSSSNSGYLSTPAVDLSSSRGKVTVSFRAKYFSSTFINDGSSVVVSCGNASRTVALSRTMANYTVVLDCNAAQGQTVRFATTAKQKRVLLDNVALYSGDTTATAASAPLLAMSETGDSTSRVITGIADTTCLVTGLTAGGTFTYRVKALYTDGTESGYSNVETVTLRAQSGDLDGDINMDGLVDVADVTTLINYVLGLNPSPCNLAHADRNGDGIYDVVDVTALTGDVVGK